jgi:hypothetical protein
MKFLIEQIALNPPFPERAIKFLSKLGANEWARDHVIAVGQVFGLPARNEANLAFNYDILDTARELEVLDYTNGPNWVEHRPAGVSHLGMHVSDLELVKWREFFEEEGIGIAQEVMTLSHTNPYIAGKRTYNYVVFDTYHILGVDLKFIVRHDARE